jgi:signal transduction histidine kinase
MFEIIIDFVNAFILVFFMGKFLKLKKANYVAYLLVGTVGYGLVIMCMNSFFYYEGMLGVGIYILVSFTLAAAFMEGSWREKLYYSLLENSVYNMIALIVAKIMAITNEKSLVQIYTGVGIKRVIGVVTVQVLCAVSLYVMYKIQTDFAVKLNVTEQNISMVLLLLTNIVVVILNKIELHSKGNIIVEEYMILVILSMLLVNMIIYYLLYRINKLNYMNLKAQELRRGIQAYENSTKEICRKYEEFRKMKHDMENSYVMITGLLQNGEREELEKYLEIKKDKLRDSNMIVYTGHACLDSLLNMKFAEIKNNKVELTYEIGITEYPGIEELDLCGIFGNLLDNALEATVKVNTGLRRINISVWGDKNKIMIVMRNTVNTACHTENGALVTTKEDKKSHGLGAKIVNELAEKYGGGFNWNVKDNEFQANVLLFLK